MSKDEKEPGEITSSSSESESEYEIEDTKRSWRPLTKKNKVKDIEEGEIVEVPVKKQKRSDSTFQTTICKFYPPPRRDHSGPDNRYYFPKTEGFESAKNWRKYPPLDFFLNGKTEFRPRVLRQIPLTDNEVSQETTPEPVPEPRQKKDKLSNTAFAVGKGVIHKLQKILQNWENPKNRFFLFSLTEQKVFFVDLIEKIQRSFPQYSLEDIAPVILCLSMIFSREWDEMDSTENLDQLHTTVKKQKGQHLTSVMMRDLR